MSYSHECGPDEFLHPLLLPEILLLIGPHLSQATVLHCLLVCRTWNTYLTPFLFQRVNLPKRKQALAHGNSKRAARPMISALQRNGANIRILICADNNMILRQIAPRCTAVETLVLGKFTTNVLPILRLCQETLVRLEFTPASGSSLPHAFIVPWFLPYSSSSHLTSPSRYPNGIPSLTTAQRNEMLNAILQLSKLQHLVLDYLNLKGQEYIETFFEFCQRQLISLELHNTAVLDSAPPTFIFNKVQSLSLVNSMMKLSDQVLLLAQCPSLEHLTWIRTAHAIPVESLATLWMANHGRHPGLKSIDCSDGVTSDDNLAILLERIPNLEILIARYSFLGPACLKIMLLNRQCQIHTLDIADCKNVSPAMVHSILVSFPTLKSLTADRIRAMDLVENLPSTLSSSSSSSSYVRSNHQGSEQWVCQSLEELRVVFVGPSLLTPYETQHVVYNQLAKLRQLRVLSVGRNASATYSGKSVLDLSLTNGLAQLASLTELKEFDFCQMDHKLGMEEFKFMLRAWRKLEAMHGHLNTEDSDRAAFVESYLRHERPGIRLKHHLKYRRRSTRTEY
ncbi:hypothetical protein EDD11_009299 [Mortierella claussenii]|nr:hypothetical protein EDD11_009299 [Mortierella claussenii]